MTLARFEPGTTRWQTKVLTNTPRIPWYYLKKKSLYLNIVQKMMLFLISAHSIVESKRAHSGLLSCFQKFWKQKIGEIRVVTYMGFELKCELWHISYLCAEKTAEAEELKCQTHSQPPYNFSISSSSLLFSLYIKYYNGFSTSEMENVVFGCGPT